MENLFRVEGPIYRICDTAARLFLVNLLLIITVLPLVTAGAALSAAHQVCGLIVEGKSSHVINEYFSVFRKNWRRASVIWLICLAVLLLLLIDLNYLVAAKKLLSWPLVGIGCVFLLAAIQLQFALPLTARYDLPLRRAAALAVKLCLAHPFISLLLFMVSVLPVILGLLSPYLFVFGMYIGLFIGPAFLLFLQQHLLLWLFKKHEV